MDTVKIKYVGHACFKLSYEGQSIVIDPYADGYVPGLGNVRESANAVYCSHGHDDHSYAAAVELNGGGEPNFSVEEIVVPHDDAEGAKRGMNTIRVFTFGSLRIAHMGDTGRDLTEEETAMLNGLDCMMIPVGGYYTIDAETAKNIVAKTQPKVVIPMHYSGCGYGYELIGTVKAFTDLTGETALHYGDPEFSISGDTAPQIRVMRPAMLNVSVRDAGIEFHNQGYNCCQSVLRACSKYSGLSLADANIGFGFAGGMYIQSVCGALTGALMSIGAACLDGEMPNPSRPDAVRLSTEMEKRFGERFNTLLCGDILAAYGGKGMCGECIAAAAEMAEEIIKEYKNK